MSDPLRVLVIDEDEGDIRRLLAELYRAGFDPAYRTASNPDALVEALSRPWDLVLCEYALRRLSGPAALDLLREHRIDAPVILVSDQVDGRMATAALRYGVSDVVDKQDLGRLGPAAVRALREAEGHRERRSAEEALREREAQLVQCQRMEAVGQFASGMVHSMNNFISVMLGGLARLDRVLEEDHPGGRYLRMVEEAAHGMGGLARQLTALTGNQIWCPENFDLAALVAESEGVLGGVAGEAVTIRYELDGPCWIDADRSHVCQALVDLCVNAREAMPDGGHVRVAVSTVEVADPVVLADGRMGRGRFAALTVEDDGPGIPLEVRSRIFEPFFSTKTGSHGHGLGLAILHGIMRRCGGAVGVDEAEGGGARFVLLFPTVEQPHAPELARGEASGARSRGPGHLLLVEDDPNLRRLLEEALREAGYEVRPAAGSRDAVEIARDGPVDVLLTDVELPGMDGIQLAEEIRRQHPRVHVLYMSGHARARLERYRLLEDEHLLSKPFTPGALVAEIASLMDPETERPDPSSS